jgi:hypothetical protein
VEAIEREAIEREAILPLPPQPRAILETTRAARRRSACCSILWRRVRRAARQCHRSAPLQW